MTNLTPCKSRRFDVRQAEHYNFGIADKRGRQIGAVVYCFTLKVMKTDERGYDVQWYCDDQIGTQYVVRFHATRDGVSYGAGHPDKWFSTEAEREDGIRKYLEAAKTRAVKAA